MNNDEIRALETLSLMYSDIVKSKEYKLGNRLLSTKKELMGLHLSVIYKHLKRRRATKIANSKFDKKPQISNLSYEDWIKNLRDNNFHGKVAVYSCIVGGYDRIESPLYLTQGFDYFMFSDISISVPGWQEIKIPESVVSFSDNTLINRYIKFHPNEFFSDYDYAIYVDGNVRIMSDLSALPQKSNNKVGIAMHKHVLRDCIYDEAEICCILGKGNRMNIMNQVKCYNQIGFPAHYGMAEATVIVSDLRNPYSNRILDEWWEEFCKTNSKRDQLSLPYVLWRNNINVEEITTLGNNIYKNPKFSIKSH